MSKNRWLLPDGINELVADDARSLEALRRILLDLFDSWGYDLVFPPIVEFTDSLLTGLGESLELQTYKFSDHQSGKTLGIRADISTQAARIDAHSMNKKGANRLCYAGTILRALSNNSSFQNRAPVQIGAELFGINELDADLEIISLMLTTLQTVSDKELTLEVSHQSIRTWLQSSAEKLGLDSQELFTLVSGKRLPELEAYIAQSNADELALAGQILELPRLMGDEAILEKAESLFSGEAGVLVALAEMKALAQRVNSLHPETALFFNLSEVQFSDYHSGLLFSAYCEVEDVAIKVANGGRYNEVGQAFGRARPATGFSADLKVLSQILLDADIEKHKAVYAPVPQRIESEPSFWARVSELREQGYRVKLGYACEQAEVQTSEHECEQTLVEKDGQWQLQSI